MYQVEIESREMNQVRMALEQGRNISRFSGLLNIFWGLIAAKCVLSEWAVERFNWSILSLYIWMPTFLFGCICTWVYAGVTLNKIHSRPLTGRFVSAIWGGCLMALALVGMGGWGMQNFNLHLLPAIFSVILGIGFFIHGVIDNRIVFKFSAYGWWLGSIGLFYQPDIDALAWFSLMIILFHVLPAFWLWLRDPLRNSQQF